ncbi:MAG: ABC transporter permease [Phycisphaerae bacterium]|nr:ABC transporter permease [Phycisphaerae bacterium]
MTTSWQDVRYALRILSKSPGFTAIALVTLAIGIGANTIMFSVVNGLLLLRPANVKDPDRLVGCCVRPTYMSSFWHSQYLAMRDDNPVFSDLTGFSADEVNLRYGEESKRAEGFFVPSNYFSTLGAAPLLGRDFLAGEDELDAQAVAVLAHQCWERYGADPDILGKELYVDGWPCRVVGVMPKGFTGTSLVGPDVWLPLGVRYQTVPADDRMKRWPERFDLDCKYPLMKLIGRLKPGLDLDAAQAQLAPLAARWSVKRPLYLDHLPRLSFGVSDDRLWLVGVSAFLLGASLFILLIACLNLANMHLVQGASRRRELAIRMAMGGSRWRVMRQLLVESLLLAVLGGTAGLLLAFWGMRVLNVSLGTLRLPAAVGLALQAGFDLRVFGATLAFTTIAALLSGLWPAVRLSRRCVAADLKEVRGSVFRSSGRTRRVVPAGLSVAGQIALSVVLVLGASLFAHSAVRAAYVTPGYSLDAKLLISMDLDGTRSGDMERLQLCQRLIDRVSALPGVQTCGLSNVVPFGDFHGIDYVALVGQETPDEDDDFETMTRRGKKVLAQAVAGDYFQSVGLPLLQGRYFTPLECDTGAPVVIVDEMLARQLRPDGDVLGCLVSGAREIVGIVPSVRQGVLKKDKEPYVYRPLGAKVSSAFLCVRLANTTRAVETSLLQQIPKEIRAVDPQISVLSAARLADHHRNGPDMWIVGMLAKLSIASGIVALFLAGLGIYGVKGYMVASRTPEIGIRMALGATSRGVLAMVLCDGAVLTIVGLAVGMSVALTVTRFVRSVLCGVDPIDPLSITATVILLAGTSLLASYVPARKAAKTDPMVALRCE